MKGKSLSIIGVLFLLIGVIALLFLRSITSEGVIAVCGILFVISGVINLVTYGRSEKQRNGVSRLLGQIANAAAVVLGICMLVFMPEFKPMVAYIFGIIVAVCALWQFFVLAVGARPSQLPGWLYVFPLLMVAGAIFIFVRRTAADSTLILALGVSLAVMGLGCLLEGAALGIANKRRAKAQTLNPVQGTAESTAAAEREMTATEATPKAPEPAENTENKATEASKTAKS